MKIDTHELIVDFEKFAHSYGYSLPLGRMAEYVDKNTPLRFSRDGGRDQDCFAYLHSNGVGVISDWHDITGSKVIFNFFERNGKEITKEEQEALDKEAKAMEAEANKEAEEKYRKKAEECVIEFGQLPGMEKPIGYFANKKFEKIVGDIRAFKDTAVVPFFDGEGHISTLQYIYANNRKNWKSGARKAGSFFPIGFDGIQKERFFLARCYLVEGVATGLSVHLATKIPTVVAGDVGNLLTVSKLFLNSVVIADYDIPSHTGEEKAKETGRPVIVIKNPENSSVSFDADDFRQLYGLEALGEYIESKNTNYFMTLSQFKKKHKNRGYVVKNVINKSSVNCIFGASNTGKTYVMLDLALSVAIGKESWHGARIHRGPVVYFCAEGQAALSQRIEAWAKDNNVNEDELDGVFWLHDMPETLSDETVMSHVISEVDALPQLPSLVCLDTFIRFLEGDEKDSSDVVRLLNSLEDLNNKGIAVLYTNHPGKNPDSQDSQTGSYRNKTNIDNEFTLQVVDDEVVNVYQTKARDGRFYQLSLRLPIVTMGIDEDGEEVTQKVVHTEKEIAPMTYKKKAEEAKKEKPKKMTSQQQKDRKQFMLVIADQWVTEDKDKAKENDFIQRHELDLKKAKNFMIERFKTINPNVEENKIVKRVNDMMNPKRKDNIMCRLSKYGYITEIITDEDDHPAIINFDADKMNLTPTCNTIWFEIKNTVKTNNDELWKIADKVSE